MSLCYLYDARGRRLLWNRYKSPLTRKVFKKDNHHKGVYNLKKKKKNEKIKDENLGT